MKKEGIQTRNRKLSSKSKKKKGMAGGCLPIGSHLGMSDLMKPLDPSKAFSGGFPTSMGKNTFSFFEYNIEYCTVFAHRMHISHFLRIYCTFHENVKKFKK